MPGSRSKSVKKNYGVGRVLRSCRKSQQCRRTLHYTKPDIWCLPVEVAVLIFRGLHVKDLLTLRSSHPHFRDILDANAAVWAHASFQDVWPAASNMGHFDRAADAGNISALVKLGVAYLYNEGLPGHFAGKQITNNGERAAEYFCRVEAATPRVAPFTWLFIRPPWAMSGKCCKECVFACMKKYAVENNTPSVRVCVARTLSILDDLDLLTQGQEHLDAAVKSGSPHAAFLQWQDAYQSLENMDPGRELQAIRHLRDITTTNCPEAVLELCSIYAEGHYGGISHSRATAFVRGFVQSTRPSGIHRVFQNSIKQDITHSMRYILVDWLVEVAGMKDFSSLTLHVAINVVDRYLMLQPTSRCRLQLLGVSAMVLCSRFLGKDIITIREAAWLTDNTYKYEDVVRMMGEITASLSGRFRVLTTLDMTQLLGRIAGLSREQQCIAEYVCEMALLHSDLGQYPLAEIAAACTLLTNIQQRLANPWPERLAEMTGFCLDDISHITQLLHNKCFVETPLVDHREVVLQAVKNRYHEGNFHFASTHFQTLKAEEVQSVLGIPEGASELSESETDESFHAELIMSPSRRHAKSAARSCTLSTARENAATPTLEENLLNVSMSGYEGDKEDEDESFLDEDFDHDFSVWNANSILSNQSSQRTGDCSASFSDDSCRPKPQAIPRPTINLPTSRCYATPTLLSGSGCNQSSPTWSTTYMFRRSPSCGTDGERVDGILVTGPAAVGGSSGLAPRQSWLGQRPLPQVSILSPTPTSSNGTLHHKTAIPSHCDTPRSRRPALKTLKTDPMNVSHSPTRKAMKTLSRVARARKRPNSSTPACTSQPKVPFF